jgi:glycosyltransferase involved in cell wall biosynthesis
MARVLINFLGGNPDHLSGIAIYALRQIEVLLRRRQHDYTILTSWPRDRLAEHLPLEGIPIIQGRSHGSEKVQYLLENWQAWRAARRIKADTVFTPWPFGPGFGGKRRVLVLHDLYRVTHPELHNWHFRLGWNLMFPFSVWRSSTVVTVSDATRHLFETHYPWAAGKARTVLEASTLRAAPRAERPLPQRYALVVSTPAATKNLARLVSALAKLEAEGRGIAMVWIGRDDGSVRQALAAHPACTRFHMPGRVDDETLATWYAHADFYVAPSLTEGFCLPVVEAQKHGVPVVCSDIDVLREVAGDGALFFDPLDVDDMAATIACIADDRALRAELAAAALDNSKRFSWDRSAAELEAIFAA